MGNVRIIKHLPEAVSSQMKLVASFLATYVEFE
jgi:hypothetical protein